MNKGELFLIAIGLISGGLLELGRAGASARWRDTLTFVLASLLVLSALAWATVIAVTTAKEDTEDYTWIASWAGLAVLGLTVLVVGICVGIAASAPGYIDRLSNKAPAK